MPHGKKRIGATVNLLSVVFAALIAFAPLSDNAAQTAFDSAADSAYNIGWPNGNGGFGWGAGWSINTSDARFAFIGSSTLNGSGDPEGDGDINSPRNASGRAWGLAGDLVTATRAFNGALSVGQTFSIDFDDIGQRVGGITQSVTLLAPDASIAISVHPSQDYFISYAGSNTAIDTGVADTDQGIHLAFTKTATGFSVSLTPYLAGATTAAVSVPYAGDVTAVELISANQAAPSASSAMYANNIAITPEPSSAALVLFAAACLAARPSRTDALADPPCGRPRSRSCSF